MNSRRSSRPALTSAQGKGYVLGMAARAQDWERSDAENAAGPAHDDFVKAKVRKGLEQSRDRAAMIPIEQAWRDLTR